MFERLTMMLAPRLNEEDGGGFGDAASGDGDGGDSSNGMAMLGGDAEEGDGSAQEGGQGEGQGQDGGDQAKSSAAKKAAAKRRRIKVLGREREIAEDDPDEIDLDDLELELKANGQPVKARLRDLAKDYELRTASHQRMREAADKAKERDQWIERMRSDHGAMADFLSEHVGVEDPYKWAEDGLLERIELEAMLDPDSPTYDPKGYAKKQIEQQQREHQRKQRIAEAQQKRQQEQAAARQAAERYRAEVPKALAAEGLKVSPMVIGLMSVVENRAAKAGRQMQPAELAYEARRMMDDELSGHLQAMEPARVLEALGKEAAKKLRQHMVNEFKKGAAGSQRQTSNGHSPAPRQQRQQSTARSLEEILQGFR